MFTIVQRTMPPTGAPEPTLVNMIAIVGAAGAIGHAVAAELSLRSTPCRVVGRDRSKLEAAFAGKAEIAPADIAVAAQAESALAGVDTVVYGVGVPYQQFELHPILMRKTIDAARRAGVKRLAVISSVYGYGVPQSEPVSETHPREPQTRKGRLRKEQEDIALAAHSPDGLQTLVLRLPDFYGPHAELSLADLIFRGALENKTANWIGSLDLPHEFVFVPDVGPVLADLIAREDSFGQAWNFAGPGTITGREFATEVYGLTGQPPRIREVAAWMLKLGGLFNPLLRELVELHYLGTTPLILDDTKLHNHLEIVRKTPYRDAIRQTMNWYKSNARG